MNLLYLTNQTLSPKAASLVDFDADSIRQIVAGRHGNQPTSWLADPAQYERNGRVLRDSTSPRLLAYSPEDQTLYVTDGCNSCAHHLSERLNNLSKEQRQAFSEESSIRPELLDRLAGSL